MQSAISPNEEISVIIPTLNEDSALPAALQSLGRLEAVEIIITDGGSLDGTRQLAIRCGARVLSSPAGRAKQLNLGAEAASGDILLFLHADTLLPRHFGQHVRAALSAPQVVGGAFELRIDAPNPRLRCIERLANWRSRQLQLPYGDQALFVRSEVFRALGGFPDLPIMEDFEFVRRLRRRGRLVILPDPVVTSARRWERLGVLRTTLINQLTILGYLSGIHPSRLASFYGRTR